MIAAIVRLYRRLHISLLRSRQNQLLLAMEHAALDTYPGSGAVWADMLLEHFELGMRIEDLQARL